jgi:hypothetical protein
LRLPWNMSMVLLRASRFEARQCLCVQSHSSSDSQQLYRLFVSDIWASSKIVIHYGCSLNDADLEVRIPDPSRERHSSAVDKRKQHSLTVRRLISFASATSLPNTS